MAERLGRCGYPRLKIAKAATGVDGGEEGMRERLKTLFLRQAENVRGFVKKYPSHNLVEVAIDSPDAGDILGREFFGVPDSEKEDELCWNQHNVNTDEKAKRREVIKTLLQENNVKEAQDVRSGS